MSNFITPKEALELYRNRAKGVSPSDFFNNPKYGHVQDIWCAVKFALSYEMHVHDCKVNIESDKTDMDADFELLVANTTYPFQTTEALDTDRRRGTEYKNKDIEPTPKEADWSKGTMLAPKIIVNAINKKISKCYARADQLNLLVYVNIRAWELNITDIKQAVNKLSIPFSSLWLLSSAGLCSIYNRTDMGMLPKWKKVADWDET